VLLEEHRAIGCNRDEARLRRLRSAGKEGVKVVAEQTGPQSALGVEVIDDLGGTPDLDTVTARSVN
jgi:hypothetical protein